MNITVYGTPAPQGSKRHVGNGVMVESSAKVKPWREAVKHATLDTTDWHTTATIYGPVSVYMTFYLRRPKGHYRTGKNADTLRDGAPTHPSGRPDIDKLVRATLDGLGEAGVWADDSQVVSMIVNKVYADSRPPGAHITVYPLYPL